MLNSHYSVIIVTSPVPRQMLHITARHRKPKEEQQGGSVGCAWSATLTWWCCQTRPHPPGDTIKTPFPLPSSKQSLGPDIFVFKYKNKGVVSLMERADESMGRSHCAAMPGVSTGLQEAHCSSFLFSFKGGIRIGMLKRWLLSLYWLFRVNLWHLAGPRVEHGLWRGLVERVFSWHSSLFRRVSKNVSGWPGCVHTQS